MSKTYEAIYEDGHLEWLGEQPGTGRYRLLVTVVESGPRQRSPQEIHRMLEATRGAWGRNKTLDEIDAEIDMRRAEWDQDEHRQ
ncbi:MAG: hypothetical protein OEU26_28890 [Candidatus Tectomicrobia bacterium]|nr:hypothetical protein [Candidatus Tectomicrobia bacterium]